MYLSLLIYCLFFFFNDTATTEIYTLSLHDALPIARPMPPPPPVTTTAWPLRRLTRDRKSTRLNSSHPSISYAVFCLKKKKTNHKITTHQPKKTTTPENPTKPHTQ